eukprot:jgi/Orpsp1_1/1175878/evm.model.c7180000055561.1
MKIKLFLISLFFLESLASECHPDYKCCEGCHAILTDEEGKWGAENKEWCFINESQCKDFDEKQYVIDKYPICSHCKVHLNDEYGDWGVENNEWCYISKTKCSSTGNDENGNENPVTELHTNIVPIISIVGKTGTNNFVNDPVTKHVSDITCWNTEKPPYPYYEECTITVEDEHGEKVINDATGKVKVRGNWTTDYVKKSLKINFDEKHSLLGLNNGTEFKNWLLLAEYKDNSLLRSKTSFDVSSEILSSENLYVSDSKFVEVKINGEYYGVYLLAEVQQINKGRINITKPKDGYTGTDIGYLLEYDTVYAKYEDSLQSINMRYNNNAPLKPYDGLGGSGITIDAITDNMQGYSWEDYFIYGMEEIEQREKEKQQEESTDQADESTVEEIVMSHVSEEYVQNVLNMSIKSDIYSQEQHDFISNYINKVYQIMYEAAYNQHTLKFNEDYTELMEAPELSPKEAIENVIDVHSLADMYIISELTCDADLYFSSFYMDVDFGKNGTKKLRFEAPWDFDSGLGNRKSCLGGKGFFAGNINGDCNVPGTYQINPWLAVTMYEDWYQEIIRDKWSTFYDNGIFKRMTKNVLEDSKKYEEVFLRDYEKWDNEIRRNAIGTEVAEEEINSKTEADSAAYLSK